MNSVAASDERFQSDEEPIAMTSWTPLFATLSLAAVVTLAAAAPTPQQQASAGHVAGAGPAASSFYDLENHVAAWASRPTWDRIGAK